MSLSDITDLYARDGKHSHSKVMVFGCTIVVWATVLVNLLWGARPLNTAEAVLLGAVLLAPYGLDGFKAFAKMRHGSAP